MTEKQIEQLKKVLADSKLADCSTELDAGILKSAHESAQEVRAKLESRSDPISFLGFVPVSFLRSATLAIALTIGVFLVMGQMLIVDDNIVALDSTEVLISKVAENSSTSEHGEVRLEIHDSIVVSEIAPRRLSRDQILLSFELSDAEDLLAELPLNFNSESLSEGSEIEFDTLRLAMIDINSYIRTGELDNARERYGDLKMKCGGCDLPDTLEALVLAAQKFVTRIDASKTG